MTNTKVSLALLRRLGLSPSKIRQAAKAKGPGGRKPDLLVADRNKYLAFLVEALRVVHGGGRTSLKRALRDAATVTADFGLKEGTLAKIHKAHKPPTKPRDPGVLGKLVGIERELSRSEVKAKLLANRPPLTRELVLAHLRDYLAQIDQLQAG